MSFGLNMAFLVCPLPVSPCYLGATTIIKAARETRGSARQGRRSPKGEMHTNTHTNNSNTQRQFAQPRSFVSSQLFPRRRKERRQRCSRDVAPASAQELCLQKQLRGQLGKDGARSPHGWLYHTNTHTPLKRARRRRPHAHVTLQRSPNKPSLATGASSNNNSSNAEVVHDPRGLPEPRKCRALPKAAFSFYCAFLSPRPASL